MYTTKSEGQAALSTAHRATKSKVQYASTNKSDRHKIE